jgi:glutamine amidotransferase
MITIVDYGVGNLGSIKNMFKRIGVAAEIQSDLDAIDQATKILLPGVGKFDAAMLRINESGLREILERKALVEKVPVLGICLGMQLLTKGSEEGVLDGLGWIDAHARHFQAEKNLKVPHMGWNLVQSENPNYLIDQLPDESRFYFVHSYYVKVAKQENSLLKTTYGHEFDSAIVSENIFGVQFHPEKSHKFGMALFEQFAEL